MKQIIESANGMNQAVAQAAQIIIGPFKAAYRLAARYRSAKALRAASLFWSVFGPAAQYDFGNPKFAYAASMKH